MVGVLIFSNIFTNRSCAFITLNYGSRTELVMDEISKPVIVEDLVRATIAGLPFALAKISVQELGVRCSDKTLKRIINGDIQSSSSLRRWAATVEDAVIYKIINMLNSPVSKIQGQALPLTKFMEEERPESKSTFLLNFIAALDVLSVCYRSIGNEEIFLMQRPPNSPDLSIHDLIATPLKYCYQELSLLVEKQLETRNIGLLLQECLEGKSVQGDTFIDQKYAQKVRRAKQDSLDGKLTSGLFLVYSAMLSQLMNSEVEERAKAVLATAMVIYQSKLDNQAADEFAMIDKNVSIYYDLVVLAEKALRPLAQYWFNKLNPDDTENRLIHGIDHRFIRVKK